MPCATIEATDDCLSGLLHIKGIVSRGHIILGDPIRGGIHPDIIGCVWIGRRVRSRPQHCHIQLRAWFGTNGRRAQLNAFIDVRCCGCDGALTVKCDDVAVWRWDAHHRKAKADSILKFDILTRAALRGKSRSPVILLEKRGLGIARLLPLAITRSLVQIIKLKLTWCVGIAGQGLIHGCAAV